MEEVRAVVQELPAVNKWMFRCYLIKLGGEGDWIFQIFIEKTKCTGLYYVLTINRYVLNLVEKSIILGPIFLFTQKPFKELANF